MSGSTFFSAWKARARSRRLGLTMCLMSGLVAHAQTIVQNTFEDGTLQGWSPRGGVALSNSTAQAHAGTGSLLTTNRTATWNGPSLNLSGLLAPGATYQISAWTRLPAGTPATQVKLTVQRGANNYDGIASSATNGVTDTAWTQLTGLYSFADNPVPSLLLYAESSSATASYYLDDVVITKISDAPGLPPNTTGLSSNFESGTQGWFARGGAIATSSESAHGGSQSLKSSSRTASWNGPAYDVTNVMFNGSTYKVSAWVKLAASAGSSTAQLRMSLQRDAGSITSYHTVVNNTTVGSTTWVRLQATYPVALANTKLTLYVESNAGTSDFLVDDVQVTYVPPPSIQTSIPSVAQSQAAYFPIGSIGYTGGITGVQGELLAKHFNSLVGENEMKWDALQGTRGTFNYSNADAQVAFAKSKGMKMRGHTFVWHSQAPAWIFQDNNGAALPVNAASKALVLQRVVDHITAVAGHFSPDIGIFYAWDVANEVIDGTQADCMRRSNWYTYTGTDFIDTAFRTARSVLPATVKLYYNDYSTTDAPKLACIKRMVSDLKSRGVPIDGIGHQMHIQLNYPTPKMVSDMVLDLANTFPGIAQQVTEMDIGFNSTYSDYDDIPASVHAQLGYAYRNYFNAFRQLNGLINSVTIWGQADNHTWLTSGSKVEAPLFFDTNLKAKPAYWGVVDPSQLPGINLSGSILSKAGTPDARVWTFRFSNPGPGVAYGVKAAGFSLRQTSGAACTPVVKTGLPVTLGDIAAGGTADLPVTIDFSNCAATAMFAVDLPFNAAGGWHGDPAKGSSPLSVSRGNQFR